jgi:flagellin
MRIQNNVSALNAHRYYGINQTNTQKSIAKLSSGYRINSAADDAAGLAISEKMRAQIRGLTMASKNTQDAISLIQTAEGGMQEIDNMLQRIRELTVYASNDTNDLETGDRQKIQDEIDSLIEEIDSMADRVEFNNKKIINGSFSDPTKVVADLTSRLAQLKTIANSKQDEFTSAAASLTGAATAYAAATSTYSVAAGSFTTAAASYGTADTDFKAAQKTHDTEFINWQAALAAFDASDKGTNAQNDLTNAKSDWDSAEAAFTSASASWSTAVASYTGAQASYNNEKAIYAKATADYNEVESKYAAAAKGSIKANEAVNNLQTRIVNISKAPKGSDLYFQIGANSDQKLVTNIGSLKSNILGIGDGEGNAQIDVRELSGSEITELIDQLDEALLYVTTERSKLGAAQNRLEYTMNSLDISAENLTAAESRIRDVDMAKEMSNFTKQNILFQASIAMLAQANAFPQGVLQLLG